MTTKTKTDINAILHDRALTKESKIEKITKILKSKKKINKEDE